MYPRSQRFVTPVISVEAIYSTHMLRCSDAGVVLRFGIQVGHHRGLAHIALDVWSCRLLITKPHMLGAVQDSRRWAKHWSGPDLTRTGFLLSLRLPAFFLLSEPERSRYNTTSHTRTHTMRGSASGYQVRGCGTYRTVQCVYRRSGVLDALNVRPYS